jgi:aromatic-L-amino-acid decarboxylase
MDRLNASGRLHLSHTRLGDKVTLRLSVGQTNTQKRHVEQAWALIQQTAQRLG